MTIFSTGSHIWKGGKMTTKDKAIELLGEKKEGIEIKGVTVKCKFPNDCNFPICDCSEVELTKNTYMPIYNRGINQMHSKAVKVVVGLLGENKELLGELKRMVIYFERHATKLEGKYKVNCAKQAISKAEE